MTAQHEKVAQHDGQVNPSYIQARHDLLALLSQTPERVLDVGCATGALGKAIREKFPRTLVVGLEYDEGMGEYAKAVLDEVHIVNLNTTRLVECCQNQRFDAIFMGDILEHLIDPWQCMQDAAQLLTDNGVIITSIPNVRHISTFIHVAIYGRWPLNPRGIHDRTHLRWFTHKNILDLFSQAGLEIIREKRKLRIFEGIHTLGRLNRYARYLDLPILREFLTFQYIHSVRRRQKGQ